MTDERNKPLDPARELMMAALYGELSTGETKRFEALLERDEDLRAEWDELRGTRRFISVAGFEEDEADFSFTLPVELPSGRPDERPAATAVRGAWRRWGAVATGFAAAAAIFIALLWSGLRVDQTPGGWLIGFGGVPELQADASHEPELTREDFASFARELVTATDHRLTRMEERQAGEQAVLARGFLEALDIQQQELSLHQQRYYEDLRARVELVAYGLAASQRPRRTLQQMGEER